MSNLRRTRRSQNFKSEQEEQKHFIVKLCDNNRTKVTWAQLCTSSNYGEQDDEDDDGEDDDEIEEVDEGDLWSNNIM